MAIAIGVHGGCGPRGEDDAPEAAIEGALRAAREGYAVLQRGGSALDAVVAAAVTLEDDPQFNAGTGSTLTEDGTVEMDASVMVGESLLAGAVTGVRRFKNPIRIARAVMEKTPHVMLFGEGAEKFAREHGFPEVDPATLITDRIRAKWQRALERREKAHGNGTIGAVAVDAQGHVAAATSTGGMLLKRTGRVGDTPIIGAGTFADDAGAAVSCTGHGEKMIRTVLAKRVSDLVLAGITPATAAGQAILELERIQGEGGLIVVDKKGRFGWACNTERMTRAWIDAKGEGSGFFP